MNDFPTLYQINTRVWLSELSRTLDRPVTLDDISDTDLTRFQDLGFNWIWLLGVWQTGPAGRDVARANVDIIEGYRRFLPDLADADICGSPFAVQAYHVNTEYGGDAALARLRDRMRQRGLRLLLDFVPNHTALDNAWVQDHSEYYVHGDEQDVAHQPQNYRRMQTAQGAKIMAHGRDPYFDGWTDTLQLNYRHPKLREAVIGELTRIAAQCDGVRCDMAMLLLPDVIERTWGARSLPADGAEPVDSSFWLDAIPAVRRHSADFTFVAEAYWDLEWTLEQQGFDFAYDKRLYDRLHGGDAPGVWAHLNGDFEFERRAARFLENHDEPRAAASFPLDMHRAASMVTYLSPGLRFFHEGQLVGRRVRVPMQFSRRPEEPIDHALELWYARLLEFLKSPLLHQGNWRLLPCRAAWEDNPTWDRFLVFQWDDNQGETMLVAVNFGPTQGQCYVEVPFAKDRTGKVALADRFSTARYERDTVELAHYGLYLDMPAWGYHGFDVLPI